METRAATSVDYFVPVRIFTRESRERPADEGAVLDAPTPRD